MSKRVLSAAIVLAAGHVLIPSASWAAAPSAAAFGDLMNGWRAAGATVTVGKITELAGDDRIEVRDLAITEAKAGDVAGAKSAVFTIGRIELAGLARTASGYAVRAIDVKDFKLSGSDASLAIDSVVLQSLNLPTQGWPEANAEKPIASFVAGLKAVARVGVASAELANLRIQATNAPAPILAIDQASARGIAGGRIEAFSLGALATLGQQTSIDSIASRNVDLTVLQRVFDSATYQPVPPDRVWAPLVSDFKLSRLQQRFNGGTLRVADATISDLQMRTFGSNVPQALEAVSRNPTVALTPNAEGRAVAAELTNMLLLGSLSVNALAVDMPAAPVRNVTCDAVTLSQVTLRAVKEAAARTCALAAAPQTVMRVAGVVVRDLSADRLIESSLSGPQDFAPTLGQLQLTDAVLTQGAATVALGKLNLSMDAAVRGIPTRIDFALERLDVPTASIADPNARAALTAMEIETATLGLNVKASWRETARELEIEQVSLGIEQLGRLSATATITEVPRSVFEAPDTVGKVVAGAGLRRFRVLYEDNSLAQRALTQVATANKQSAEDLRKALSRAVPNILAQIPDATARGKLTFALLSFINAPGSLELSSGINEPVPLATLQETARTAIPALPGLLKLNAVATKPTPGKPG